MTTTTAKIQHDVYATTAALKAAVGDKHWGYSQEDNKIWVNDSGSWFGFTPSAAVTAALVSTLGITGVTPTGGSSGDPGTAQAMMEGLGLLSAQTAGTFTMTLTGFSGSPVTCTATWTIRNGWVCLIIPIQTGTSNSALMTATGIPSDIQPTVLSSIVGLFYGLEDNGNIQTGTFVFTSGSVIQFGTLIPISSILQSGSFTASGTKGFALPVRLYYPIY